MSITKTNTEKLFQAALDNLKKNYAIRAEKSEAERLKWVEYYKTLKANGALITKRDYITDINGNVVKIKKNILIFLRNQTYNEKKEMFLSQMRSKFLSEYNTQTGEIFGIKVLPSPQKPHGSKVANCIRIDFFKNDKKVYYLGEYQGKLSISGVFKNIFKYADKKV